MLDTTVLYDVSRYKTLEDDIKASLPSWRVLQEEEETQLTETMDDLLTER